MPPTRTLQSIADVYWEFWQGNNSELATQSGEYRYNDRLSEYSIEHYEAVKKDALEPAARLKAVDVTGLNEADRLDASLLTSALKNLVRSIDLNMFEMPVEQFSGVHIAIPEISTFAPFDPVRHYEDYISRMRQIPGRLNS